MLRRILVLLLACLACEPPRLVAAATPPRYSGVPFLRVWQPEDYNGAPGNRSMLQHPQSGFIYVANGNGVLEFDGSRWRIIRVPGGAAQNLAVDGRGRVWFANDNQVGCLAPDERGELRAESALARLPAGEPPIFPLGAAASAPNGVYFINRDRVFFFGDDDSPARVWRPGGAPLAGQLWWMDGELHLRTATGVQRLHAAEFRDVDGLRTFAFATRRDPQGGWQLVSRDGVRRWDGAYLAVAPGLSSSVSPLDGDFALNAVFLTDGRIAWGTTRSGVIVSDQYGRKLQVIAREQGLPSNRIEGLCEDREGGLWVALRNGLARLQLHSPYARHGPGEPLDTTPQAFALYRDHLYVGGGEGLARRDDAGKFQKVEGLSYLARNLVPHDGRLFVTGLELRQVLPDDRSRLLDTTCYGLVPLTHANGLYARGSPDGLWLNRLDGDAWQRVAHVEKISGATTALLEWPAGVVWAANHTSGLWRIDVRTGARVEAATKNFGAEDGLSAGINQYNVELFPFGGGLIAAVQGRLLRFEGASGRFAPEARISGLPAAADGAVRVLRIAAGADQTALWMQGPEPDYTIYRIVRDGPDRWHAEPPPRLPMRAQRATALLHDAAAHTLWIGTPGALVSRDLDWRPGRDVPPFRAQIRRVETDGGTLLWADGAPPTTLALPPAHNALRIVYAAPTYNSDHTGHPHTAFRTRLDGLDREWSRWTVDARRDFTNLPYRDFVFHVQALDTTGRPSEQAMFAFTIAPPWWLTHWAFGGYVVLGAGALAGLFALRTRTLRRRNEALEQTVAARTAELHQQNVELARLHRLELDEKISAQLAEEKARLEVLRYQLNPHFLFNALNSVCAQIIREPVTARSMVVRLADFCRLTLHRPHEEEAMTIAQELKMLRAYLEIEQARLGDLMTIEITADPAAETVRVPPFLLLPLVENAVKYGTATSTERVGIRLSVRHEGAAVVLEVANTGAWLAPGTHSAPSHGIGLENLRQRLARYFPDAHEFSTSAADGWVTVRVRLTAPLREHPHSHH